MASLTATHFLPEILSSGCRSMICTVAYGIQILHDGVCIYFFLVFLGCLRTRDPKTLCILNMMHCVIIGLFCYFKRCVLTLGYNHVLGIDMCTRYIPIWQRTANVAYRVMISSCPAESWETTYLWLNNHILQTVLVLVANAGYAVKMFP